MGTGGRLGTSSAAFGERAGAHRAQLEETFGRIVDLALEEQCDLLLVSGDLFDAARPGRRLVRFVTEQLARLAERATPTYACLLPGTHDCYGPGTVYADAGVWSGMGHVRVFTPGVRQLDFPDLSAYVTCLADANYTDLTTATAIAVGKANECPRIEVLVEPDIGNLRPVTCALDLCQDDTGGVTPKYRKAGQVAVRIVHRGKELAQGALVPFVVVALVEGEDPEPVLLVDHPAHPGLAL